jgi:UDP-N-acetylmuramate dehydrogenase
MNLPAKTSLSMQHDVSLKALTTFGVEAIASHYLQIQRSDQLKTIRQDSVLAALPRLILGGGSNLLLTRDLDVLVLHMMNRGITLLGEEDGQRLVQAQAGENWHSFVQWTLEQGWGGLENLSLIPGTVGAAPIQNIGAYGSELSQHFHSLHYFDFEDGEVHALSREECEFGYRDSVFKQRLRGRAVILDVTFALPMKWQPQLGYAELVKELSDIPHPTASEISSAVVAIRSRKLPDPAVIGNAGSFFKNPVVTASVHADLNQRYPELVSYAQADSSFKLAAAWLIDQCGWKGKSLGAAGVHDKQALVLINRGGATGAEILALAERIRSDVALRFGVSLESEPVVL